MFQLFGKKTLVVAAVLLAFASVVYVKVSTKEPTQAEAVVDKVPEPPLVSKTTIGTSVSGRNIEAYSFGNGDKHLVFVGGIHGGYEWNSVALAYTFIDYLNEHPETIPRSLTVVVVPSANPDGLYKVTKKEGRFLEADVATDELVLASGRFNARDVDLNRNFDCDWQPKSVWRNKTVSAGSAPFSEPETLALKNFLLSIKPVAAVFWHSQAGGVYASRCGSDPLPETLKIMDLYALTSKYKAVKTFDAYTTTGAADDWLASVGIPAVTVELKTHTSTEWEANLAGVQALLEYYGN